MNEAQLETINNVSPRGVALESGLPCECSGAHYSTSKKRHYSDTMVYEHTCGKCGNEFKTWTEG